MMRDLFTDMPPIELDANYATRMAHLWIRGDPDLDQQCRDLAREWAELGDRDCWDDEIAADAFDNPMLALAAEFRVRIVASALAAEQSGLFFELFSTDVHEIDWSALANLYLDMAMQES